MRLMIPKDVIKKKLQDEYYYFCSRGIYDWRRYKAFHALFKYTNDKYGNFQVKVT